MNVCSLKYSPGSVIEFGKDVQNAGGILSIKYLKIYTVKQKEPISNDVIGLTLLGMPPPSGGHPMMLVSLSDSLPMCYC